MQVFLIKSASVHSEIGAGTHRRPYPWYTIEFHALEIQISKSYHCRQLRSDLLSLSRPPPPPPVRPGVGLDVNTVCRDHNVHNLWTSHGILLASPGTTDLHGRYPDGVGSASKYSRMVQPKRGWGGRGWHGGNDIQRLGLE